MTTSTWNGSVSVFKVKKERAAFPMPALNRKLGVLMKVALLAFDAHSALCKCIQCHGDVLRAGHSLVKNVTALENLGKDAKARIALDPHHTTLTAVVKSRDALAAAKGKLEEQSNLLCPTQTMSGDDQDQDQENKTKNQIIDMWNTATVKCYDQWIDSEVVMDCVATASVQCREKLERTHSAAMMALNSVVKDNSWKSTLPADCSLADARTHAKETLYKIPEKKNLKALVDKVSEESGPKGGQSSGVRMVAQH